MPPSAVPSIRVVKTMLFKSGTRQWSNRYYFTGGTPPDATHWHTLMDAITTAERPLFGSNDHVVEALGYAAGSDVPVATKTYSLAGTLTPAGGSEPVPGECAALLRWSTAKRSTKNHPVYLFNYFHSVYNEPGTNYDLLDSVQKANLATYAASWLSGFSDGGSVSAKRAGPDGTAATGSIVEEYITHRDFPHTPSL